MPLYRLRAYWEDDEQVYRDVELLNGHSFFQLHETILKAFDFDSQHAASFFESNDKWERLREFSSDVLVNKKGAEVLSMLKTPVSALISRPEQKFVYEYDRLKKWTFLIELIGIANEGEPNKTYPSLIRKEGIAPAQYGLKPTEEKEEIAKTEEAYDLAGDEDGFGSEGDDSTEEEDTEGSSEGYDED